MSDFIDLVCPYVLLFFIYSFLGWLIESTKLSIQNKKFINRGFLLGPLCPIYGFGGLAITFLLNDLKEHYFIVFCMSIFICGIFEYLVSYLMEKIFHARWWDYSDRVGNINGRVCLRNLLFFGLFCCLMLYVFNPLFLNLISYIPRWLQLTLSIVLVVIASLDIIFSATVIKKLERVSTEVTDNTDEISEEVKEIIHSKSKPYRRFIEAYPNIKDKVKYKTWTIKQKIQSKTEEIKEKRKTKTEEKEKEKANEENNIETTENKDNIDNKEKVKNKENKKKKNKK